MNGSVQGCRRRLPLLLAAVVVALVVIPAAGSGAAEGGNASAHDVAEGLKKIQSIAVDAAAYSGKDKAKSAQFADSIEGVWKPIEDTVRGNEKNSYIIFENAFESLGAAAKAGDATKAGRAANQVSTAVRGYLASHPDVPAATPRASSAAAATPSGSAASAPSASAAPAPSAGDAAAATGGTEGAPAPTAGAANLARTGPHAASGLTAGAGAAFALGGLALIVGARRRRTSQLT